MGEAIFAPEKGQRPDEMRSANGAYSAICTRQMAILRELNSPGGGGPFRHDHVAAFASRTTLDAKEASRRLRVSN